MFQKTKTAFITDIHQVREAKGLFLSKKCNYTTFIYLL